MRRSIPAMLAVLFLTTYDLASQVEVQRLAEVLEGLVVVLGTLLPQRVAQVVVRLGKVRVLGQGGNPAPVGQRQPEGIADEAVDENPDQDNRRQQGQKSFNAVSVGHIISGALIRVQHLFADTVFHRNLLSGLTGGFGVA